MATYNIANSTLQSANKTLFEMSMQHTGTLYSAPWDLQVARGKVPGVSQINIFGYSNSVSNTTFSPLWENGALTLPTTATTMNVYSSSASDTGAIVTISGLNSSYNAITETVTLAGTSNVATTNQFLRINSFNMTTPNTGQITNIGTIIAKNSSNTAVIAPTIGRMQNSWYSIPAGHSFYVRSINIFTGETKTGATPSWFYYRVRNHNNITGMHYNVLTTSFQHEYKVERSNPVRYTEKTDIEWQFISSDDGPYTLGLILEGLLISDSAP